MLPSPRLEMRIFFLLASLALILPTLTVAQSTNANPQAPSSTSVVVENRALENKTVSKASDTSYRIGVGDLLDVRVLMSIGEGQSASARVEQPCADTDDRQAGQRAQHGDDLLGRHMLLEEKHSEAKGKHTDRMGERHHCAEEQRVARGSSSADKIGRDDGFAVTGRERMRRAPHRGEEQRHQDPGRRQVVAVQQ